EYEFFEEVKTNNLLHNKEIKKCLNLLEKILINDEKIVLAERQFFKEFVELLNFTTSEEEKELLKKLLAVEVEALEVKAGYTEEGWVYICAPGFLPTEKELWLSSDFFKPIFQELARLNPENKHYKERCLVAIVQNIEEGTMLQIRDADNREHKNLSNMLTRAFLVDDSPYFCDYLYASLFKDSSYVEAFIIPESDADIFIKRLRDKEITPKKLLETMPFTEKWV
ncbi:MAG: hypothetical protein UGF89_06775, partial [Acutalibacteraceae bacterium]|nr:hypothetical protein [Acutalibacteraceae bacterium]